MAYFLTVQHIDASGRGTPCCEPHGISMTDILAMRIDVFRWMDGDGQGARLNDLRANQVVVTDENAGVLFSAFRT